MKESPIFARTHDLLLWLIPQTMKFPRSQRFVLARRVQDAALDFQEHLLEAGLSKESTRIERLAQADVALAKLRFYLRLCHEMQMLSLGQYEHVGRMVTEVGRLLGGWHRTETAMAG
jgi:cytosine/adenosine deaminase-related metal-dependent hydrolase